MCLLMLLCITSTLSPNSVPKESRWACCRSDGPLVERGGRSRGTPCWDVLGLYVPRTS